MVSNIILRISWNHSTKNVFTLIFRKISKIFIKYRSRFSFYRNCCESSKIIFNQSAHKRCRNRLGMGGQTSSPPISKYVSEIFSPSHRNLTNNNSENDFKSIKRPQEVEKFKLDRKIFSSLKIKNRWCVGFERMTPLVLASNLIHQTTRICKKVLFQFAQPKIKSRYCRN